VIVPDRCQIDFYVLAHPALSPGRLACRLCMMAWEQGHRVAVLTGSEEDASALDELMWDFPPGRFLPHALGADDAAAPVSIVPDAGQLAPGREVIINLAEDPVPEPGRFRRLLEIVPADTQRKKASRDKFRQYRDWGLSPGSHQIENV
jgi:DNA polymerase-3 subunit chi